MGGQNVTIAVMGATGSGKSTFINLLTGSNLAVGQGLSSCTASVETSKAFEIQGHMVTLIDTPGFDDTTKSDTDILKLIAGYLSTSYKEGTKLAGVIYVHRISDFRVGGISRRNFNMFRKLCGDSTLKNVFIMTNMWGEVSKDVGEARETELRSSDDFFKPALDKEARMARHDNTLMSAQAIIRQIVANRPVVLQIQNEIVNEHKSVKDTNAGEELNREILEQERKHREEKQRVQREAEEAIRAKEEEARRHREAEARRLQEEMERACADSERLAQQQARKREEMERRAREAEEEARREAERQAAEHERQMNEVREQERRRREEEERLRNEAIARTQELERLRQEEEARRRREQEDWLRNEAIATPIREMDKLRRDAEAMLHQGGCIVQ